MCNKLKRIFKKIVEKFFGKSVNTEVSEINPAVDFSKMKKIELINYADENNIKINKKSKKADIIKILSA